jgi:hypothetical protein
MTQEEKVMLERVYLTPRDGETGRRRLVDSTGNRVNGTVVWPPIFVKLGMREPFKDLEEEINARIHALGLQDRVDMYFAPGPVMLPKIGMYSAVALYKRK